MRLHGRDGESERMAERIRLSVVGEKRGVEVPGHDGGREG